MGKKLLNSRLWVLCLFLFFAGCVSIPRSFHALTYRKQSVYLSKDRFYRVGPLSAEWKQTASKNKAGVYFHNKVTGARIATEAICGAAFEDLSLKILTEQVLSELQNVKKQKQENWMLSDRAALYSIYSAALDGVPVQLNILVTKKDQCQFDFWAVSNPKAGP
ncbi:MAG: hypothetical protein A3H42_01340, partial [Deltaproteobacteria bacterium RIFCSPLOWO2_02_FULL_46_8]